MHDYLKELSLQNRFQAKVRIFSKLTKEQIKAELSVMRGRNFQSPHRADMWAVAAVFALSDKTTGWKDLEFAFKKIADCKDLLTDQVRELFSDPLSNFFEESVTHTFNGKSEYEMGSVMNAQLGCFDEVAKLFSSPPLDLTT